ncbi:MAG: thiamine biosynthesis protein [Streptosporangiaceae bacterium]|jgi:thiamine biosynthesis lipoprotein|nr:thiamine biosynthesis protein [Streptosporangiaceae bacterium]
MMIGSTSFDVWGTTACLLVAEAERLAAGREVLDRELTAVGNAASRFQADSELSLLNAAAGRPVRISPLFAELLSEALRVAVITDGAVDPTVGGAVISAGYDRDLSAIDPYGPPLRVRWRRAAGWQVIDLDPVERLVTIPEGVRLDLGATAKAFAADRAAGRIAEATGCGVLVNLGGDLAVCGPAPSGDWPVLVAEDHRAGPDAPGQTVAIGSGGLATSSTTVRQWWRGVRRLHHIIDPITGAPAATCWRTVSVAAATCVDANAAATAALVWGAGALDRLRATGVPARLVGEDGMVRTVAGWPAAYRSAA